MINAMERKKSGFSRLAQGIGTVLGGVAGSIIPGAGTAAGAALGSTLGGAAGGLAQGGGSGPQSLQPMQRRVEVMDQSPLQDVIDAKAALPEAPPAIQAQAAPILDEALKRSQQRRIG